MQENAHKLVCRGCGNSGKNFFSKDGFCVCPLGRELKVQNDAKVDRYLGSLGKGGGPFEEM